MANTITFEMTKKDQKKLESLLDDTLKVLRRLEKESPEREARIAQIQAETDEIKEDIKKELAILKKRDERLSLV